MIKPSVASMKRVLQQPRTLLDFAHMSPVARQVRAEYLTYLSPAKLVELERALAEVDQNDVKGDLVEFGLALGGSGIVLASHANGRRFHGFDLFGQIPAPTSPKDDEVARRRYEIIASGASVGLGGKSYYGYMPDLLDRVKESFRTHGVPVDGTTVCLHQGLFEASWPAAKAHIPAIALAHIDCDWYDPVRYCLEAIAALVAPGGVIALDDYFDYGGCRVATDEFVAAHPEFVVRHARGNFSLRRTELASTDGN